jgi:hypothetical protein
MFGIDDIIFSKLKYEVSKLLKTKYPNLNFTTSDKNRKDALFPNVYVKLLGSPERGQDLEGKTINAAYFTFQIETIDNESQKRAKDVMNTVLSVMKSMRFDINFPETQNTNDYYRCVARCSRMIGSGDIL